MGSSKFCATQQQLPSFLHISFHLQFTVFADIKMKTFLLFVALLCATKTATSIPTTTATPNENGNGGPLSAFLTSLKQALENLLAMVQRFENEQSTQIDHSIPRILVVAGAGYIKEETELWPKPDSQCALPDNFPWIVYGAVEFWTAQGP